MPDGQEKNIFAKHLHYHVKLGAIRRWNCIVMVTPTTKIGDSKLLRMPSLATFTEGLYLIGGESAEMDYMVQMR